MLKLLSLITVYFIINVTLSVSAYELDVTVDDVIRDKYDSLKLEQDVRNNTVNYNVKAPAQKQSIYKSIQNPQPNFSASLPQITKAEKRLYKRIPKRTKFTVKLNQNISNYSPKGTRISFTLSESVYKKDIIIPSGTKFYGEIINSHPPQRTGNGGLIVIKIDTISYNGQSYPIKGKITKVTTKKIFFNNIKGKRKYLAGVGQHIDKGEAFYNKSRKISSKMADNPIFVILSPIPSIIGLAGYTGMTVISPITAIGTKGGNLSIPSGSIFEIKLLDTAYVN